jgi:hypothetical protein
MLCNSNFTVAIINDRHVVSPAAQICQVSEIAPMNPNMH